MSTYCISDIHGEYDRYIKMLQLVDFSADDTMYILGDVIDRGPDSIKLLEHVAALMRENSHCIGNADIIIIAERPKLAKYVPQMRERIASALGCDISQISVKATTEEGLGLAGYGIGAHAAVLLERC